MKRRAAVGLSLGATASLSGCLGRVRPPAVSGGEPTLSPGAEATLSVEARSARGLRFTELPSEDRVVVDVNDAELSPSPAGGADTYPPVWYWRFARWRVAVTVPVRVPPESPPGEYRYAVGVTATGDIGSDEVTAAFSIRVADD